MSTQQLQDNWTALEGAGEHVMKQKGADFAQALSVAMDSFAQTLEQEYGVKVNDLRWQRGQDNSQQSIAR